MKLEKAKRTLHEALVMLDDDIDPFSSRGVLSLALDEKDLKHLDAALIELEAEGEIISQNDPYIGEVYALAKHERPEMQFEAKKNLSNSEIATLIEVSKHRAVRRIVDPRNGDLWYWKAELGTHAEGAQKLGVPYDKRPGEGDILAKGIS